MIGTTNSSKSRAKETSSTDYRATGKITWKGPKVLVTTKRINIMASMLKSQRQIVTLPKYQWQKYRYKPSKRSKWQPKLNAKQVSIKKLNVNAIKWEWNKYTILPRTHKTMFLSIVFYCDLLLFKFKIKANHVVSLHGFKTRSESCCLAICL